MIVTISNKDSVINWGAKGKERIVENARNIIRTKRFEVPFMRGLGLDPNHLTSVTKQLETDITSDIIDTLMNYEPRVTVLNVTLLRTDTDGECEILVELEV